MPPRRTQHADGQREYISGSAVRKQRHCWVGGRFGAQMPSVHADGQHEYTRSGRGSAVRKEKEFLLGGW